MEFIAALQISGTRAGRPRLLFLSRPLSPRATPSMMEEDLLRRLSEQE